MKKNTYSLVLMEEIVNEIDKMAYSLNTNRSNLINRILADYCSFVTPEMHVQTVFEQMNEILRQSDFQILSGRTDPLLTIRSGLDYKYNPKFRYSVELQSNGNNASGKLKVGFRTQNTELLKNLNDFFMFWIQTEQQLHPSNNIEYAMDDGKFERTFTLSRQNAQEGSESLAQSITEYIKLFDRSLKDWVCTDKDREKIKYTIQKNYKIYLKTSPAPL